MTVTPGPMSLSHQRHNAGTLLRLTGTSHVERDSPELSDFRVKCSIDSESAGPGRPSGPPAAGPATAAERGGLSLTRKATGSSHDISLTESP